MKRGCEYMKTWKTYWTMKKNEWMVKNYFYSYVLKFVENKKEMIDFIGKLYIALKDMSTDELQKEFIKAIAEIVHNEAEKTRNEES